MQSFEAALFSPALILQTAQRLRHRIRQPSNTLDIDQTIQASLERGGWLTPVYGYRKVVPEYLFLIDRASYQDHQAKLTEGLIQQLKQSGVYITRFFFDRDAQFCYSENTSQSPQLLHTLFSQYGHHRLVVVAEAEIFYSRKTAEVEPWVETLQAWEQRAILTPKPVESWSTAEFRLIQQFILLPLSHTGIQTLAQVFREGSATYQLDALSVEPFPEMLSARPQRWLQPTPPPTRETREMLAALEHYLGNTGIYWLAACAVFPELHWNITVYLGNVLKSENGYSLIQDSDLAALARLPWLRWGYLPDWLRHYLVLNLTPNQNQTVRAAFQQLMVTAVQGTVGPLQLEIAQRYQQSLPNLANPLLRLLSRRAHQEAPLRDYIFLEFMAQQSLLTVAIPDEIKPLMQGSQYERGLQRQKLAVASVFIGLLILNGGWLIWGPSLIHNQRINRLLRTAQTLAEQNRRLEALVKATKAGQMVRASDLSRSALVSKTINLSIGLLSAQAGEFRERNILTGHQGPVWSVNFSPDGETIVSGGLDRTVKLWNADGSERVTLTGHQGRVRSVNFSLDGETIVSGGDDGTVKLWPSSIETVVVKGCSWLNDYLSSNPSVSQEERAMCGIQIEDEPNTVTNPD